MATLFMILTEQLYRLLLMYFFYEIPCTLGFFVLKIQTSYSLLRVLLNSGSLGLLGAYLQEENSKKVKKHIAADLINTKTKFIIH